MEFNILDRSQLVLQCYDKGILTEGQVSELIGVNLKDGSMSGEWDMVSEDAIKAQFLMQLFDKTLITKDVLLKQLFNL